MADCDDDGFCAMPSKGAASSAAKASSSSSIGVGSSSGKKTVKIDIISDNICPWCFVGKRNLETALKSLDQSKVDVKIDWKPFFLDASLPTPGKDKMELYAKKFGEERIKSMIPHMKQVGAKVGINFSYGGKVGNTMQSHRLVEFSKRHGKLDQMIETLFSAYFEQEKDIADVDTLVSIAEKVGLDAQKTRAFLATKEYEQDVKNEVEDAYSKGISGVPAFVFNDKFLVSGGQPPEAFHQIFQKLQVL